MKKISIIGYGRFGKILATILNDFEIELCDAKIKQNQTKHKVVSLEEAMNNEIVFLATPIRTFESVVKSIAQFKHCKTTIVDVCSVKLFPVEIMHKYLPEEMGIIATHPMFGPDSFSPFRELKIVMHNERDIYDKYDYLKNIFSKQSIQVIEMNPDEHDKLAAYSQGATHFIGRVLKNSGVKSTSINTLGFNALLGVIDQTCNDSSDLFIDLQKYNPYTNEMINKFIKSIDSIKSTILEE